MRDGYLAAIIESVERGRDPVQITLALTSGAVVTGYIRRTQFFVGVSRDQARDLKLARVPAKKRTTEAYADAEAVGEDISRLLDVDVSESDAACHFAPLPDTPRHPVSGLEVPSSNLGAPTGKETC